MESSKKVLVSLMLIGLVAGCGKKEEAQTSVDPVEATMESGLSVISGMADEQAGSGYAIMNKSLPSVWDVLAPQAAVASSACSRALSSSCVSSRRSASHNGCSVGAGLVTLTGQVDLTYSQSSCLMTNNGDSVTRTYNVQFEGPRGATLSLSSAVETDYRGSSYGGGGRLTKTASGFDLEVFGRHSQLVSSRGRQLYDVSVRTLSPLSISGSLSRSSRTVISGSLEVNHNLAGFTAVFTPTNLQWSGSCCHPISGSVSVSYSGAKTGSATVNFNGCGSAQVNQDGQTQTVELSYCE
ncbi:MAG: hypothetical protein LW875_11560 [Proteobacteria bacterium]|nr:hypothetical protein [Pseudomonadota bacterium]